MQNPANLPLAGDRWTPFTATLTWTGLVLTGATLAMHVRLTYDAAAALITLGNVGSANTHGLHIASAAVLGIYINEATMEGLPAATERGDDAVFYYDLHITPSGGVKQVYARGTFTVRGGATQ